MSNPVVNNHILVAPSPRGTLLKRCVMTVVIALAIYQFVPGVKPVMNTAISATRAKLCVWRQDTGWKVWKNAKCFRPGWMKWGKGGAQSIEGIAAPTDKVETAVDYYLSQGLTPTATAYLVGSLSWESGLDPNAIGDGGKAKGLNQWWPDRRGDIPSSFEGQLEWSLSEMERDTPGTLDILKTSSDEAEIKAAIQKWTRWGIEGDRWEYAQTIQHQMESAPVATASMGLDSLWDRFNLRSILPLGKTVGGYTIATPFLYDDSPPGAWDFTLLDPVTQSQAVPVPAPCSGRVSESGWDDRPGNHIRVDCNRGDSWYFAHFQDRDVNEGDWVTKGQSIGIQGTTGNSTGPHVHLVITPKDGDRTNRQHTKPLLDKYFEEIQE
ncbi:MAG: M23 family metallopeptidase [Symploca sp. SIO3C6]|nr:M23 family metallopeptidase [Symploca sp. SIO3C6]